MDLVVLGIPAILVPTPGQSEQEYLAARLARKGWYQVIHQENLDLESLFQQKAGIVPPGLSSLISWHAETDYYEDLYRKYGHYRNKSQNKA
jgi:UDP-N-acetylglucosamine:LPS N-acetylglucosamine transferase